MNHMLISFSFSVGLDLLVYNRTPEKANELAAA